MKGHIIGMLGNKLEYIIIGGLATTTFLSGLVLSSLKVSADDSVIDDVSITVPVSCTMSGTGMNTHNAEITNGTYRADIGTTTLHAFCNDSNGFAIYAAGYTGDEIGGTNSNKLVGASTSNTIETGLATAPGNPDVSNWAMKLTATQDSGDTTGTNAFSIDSAPNTPGGADASFSQYHVVPNEYIKVAHKNSGTDMTAVTGGVKLTTTYATYISRTQPADTYTGQVIYTLIHPASSAAPVGENQIGVIYDGNGLYFDQAGTKSTNKVIYERSCEDEYGYIGNTPIIMKTRNLNADGTQNGPYSYQGSTWYEGDGLDPHYAEFEGASRLKLVINYGLSQDSVYGPYISDGNSLDVYVGDLNDNSINRNGTVTYIIDGPSTNVYMEVGGQDVNPDYNYGVYIQAYPIYDEPTEGASYDVIQNVCSYSPVIGTYAQTDTWRGKWYITNNDEITFLSDENAVVDYLVQNESSLQGTTTNIYAYNPYIINYNGNGSTAGTMTGFYTALDDDTASSTADLMAPNFKKTGYGFAGWSADSNATVNSSSKIYGPNEKVTGTDLTFDSSTRETTFYAVWVASSGDLQGWSGCSTLNSGQVIALTDTRDNNVYTVGKMQDGNCWMMENLRLDNNATISSSNTNSPISTFTALSATSDSWCTNDNAACYNQSVLNTNNINIGGTNVAGTTLTVAPGRYDGSNRNDDADVLGEYGDNYQWYGYGNYYNWYSATVGNGTSSTGVSVVASGDICPTGWHLPNGGTGTGTNGGAVSGGFSYLDKQMGGTGSNQNDNEGEEIVSNRWRSYPNNFIYSGGWYGSSAFSRGNGGDYWSRTASSSRRAYVLSFRSTYVGPGTNFYDKYYGYPVRCLAQ